MSKTLLGHIPNKNMSIKLFEFINSEGIKKRYPFRVGDIVRVEDWGESFSCYKDAFVHFIGKCKQPYYSSFLRSEDEERERKSAGEFKIIGIAEHGHNHRFILSYIKDRMGRGQVIDLDGLSLVKQMPLRIGEETTIKLEKKKKR